MSTCKRTKLDPYVTLYTKINSNCINNLNIRPETIKFPEDIGENLHDIGLRNDILDMIPEAQKEKQTYGSRFKNPLHSKGNNQQTIYGMGETFLQTTYPNI